MRFNAVVCFHLQVGRLPGAIARKLIEAQLANALPTSPAGGLEALSEAAGTDTCAKLDKQPTAEAAAVDAMVVKPSSPTVAAPAATEQPQGAELAAAQQLQPQQPAGTAQEQPAQAQETTSQLAELHPAIPAAAAHEPPAAPAAAKDGPSGQAPNEPPAIEPNAAINNSSVAPAAAIDDKQSTVSAVPAADAVPGEAAPAGDPQSASVGAVEEDTPASGVAAAQPLSALTDDVINLLLRKGLHALSAVAQTKEGDKSDAAQQQQGDAAADQPPGRDANTVAALALTGVDSSLYAQGQLTAFTAAEQPYQQQLQGYVISMSAGMPSISAAPIAAAVSTGMTLEAPIMVDGMLEYTIPHTGLYKAPAQGQAGSSNLPPRPALHEPWGAAGAAAGAGLAGAAAGTATAAAYPAGFPAGAFPAVAFPQEAYGLPQV